MLPGFCIYLLTYLMALKIVCVDEIGRLTLYSLGNRPVPNFVIDTCNCYRVWNYTRYYVIF